MSEQVSRRGAHRNPVSIPSALCPRGRGSLGNHHRRGSQPSYHGHLRVCSDDTYWLKQYHGICVRVCSGVLMGSRILCFSPNISLRLYAQWAQRILNVPALPKGEMYKTNDPIEVTVGSSPHLTIGMMCTHTHRQVIVWNVSTSWESICQNSPW